MVNDRITIVAAIELHLGYAQTDMVEIRVSFSLVEDVKGIHRVNCGRGATGARKFFEYHGKEMAW